ncbi:MAG: type I glutamate--ammonia ligase [Epsilonproteobacteria bacterium]|nr:type I glutamate--ammonia ligase [Campylobacterota bacterium]
MKDAESLLKFIKENGVKIVDVRFTDLIGTGQHFSVPISQINKESLTEGLGFDGSSIRGWRTIDSSDMLVVPNVSTAYLDPFTEEQTLNITCDIVDPISKESYDRDPRAIAKKAENYLKETGIAETAYFGPENEFFIFDEVNADFNDHSSFYFIDSDEGIWNSGSEDVPNLGHKIRHKEGYFPLPPSDTLQDIRTEMVIELEKAGVIVEAHHHEVATAGQAEIDMRFAPLLQMADNTAKFKYIVKNVARRNGKTATFMPKPLYGDNGTGMHVHQSLWNDSTPLFAGNGYAGVSDICLYYIGGILKHARALTAFTNPTTNSYKRLVPGFEAPVNLAYSSRNRSAAIRIPMYSSDPKTKRIEVRFPDPSANPYLAFSAMLLAGLDGILNKIDPAEPMDKNIYDLPPEIARNLKHLPGSLEDSIASLENDYQFLLQGNVFSEDLIRTWIDYKKENEIQLVNSVPNPVEFKLYYDI